MLRIKFQYSLDNAGYPWMHNNVYWSSRSFWWHGWKKTVIQYSGNGYWYKSFPNALSIRLVSLNKNSPKERLPYLLCMFGAFQDSLTGSGSIIDNVTSFNLERLVTSIGPEDLKWFEEFIISQINLGKVRKISGNPQMKIGFVISQFIAETM